MLIPPDIDSAETRTRFVGRLELLRLLESIVEPALDTTPPGIEEPR